MSKLSCSVAIATYNGGMYFAKQLDSILSQTHQVNEIIITDDNSKDDTFLIAKQYQQKYSNINWIIEKNEINLGYSLNFKKAISKCSGDIIFLCDQDNIWRIDKVEIMLKVFEEKPEVLVLNTDFKAINSKDEFLQPDAKMENVWIPPQIAFSSNKLSRVDLSETLGHNFAPGLTQAFRKDSIMSTYMRIKSKMVHDWLINILGALYGGCYYLNDALNYFRIHDNNSLGMETGINVSQKRTLGIKFKSFLRSFLYEFIKAKPDNNSENLFNLRISTLKMIEDELDTLNESERLELKQYHDFVNDRLYAIEKRKFFKYIKLRFKYKKYFDNQVHVKYINEKNTRLMRDLCLIIKK